MPGGHLEVGGTRLGAEDSGGVQGRDWADDLSPSLWQRKSPRCELPHHLPSPAISTEQRAPSGKCATGPERKRKEPEIPLTVNHLATGAGLWRVRIPRRGGRPCRELWRSRCRCSCRIRTSAGDCGGGGRHSFAEFSVKCRIALQRVLGHIVACGCNRSLTDTSNT